MTTPTPVGMRRSPLIGAAWLPTAKPSHPIWKVAVIPACPDQIPEEIPTNLTGPRLEL